MDIRTILTQELLTDLAASIEDIGICAAVVALGVTHHRDGFPVSERIAMNEKIIEVIRAELWRRDEQREGA